MPSAPAFARRPPRHATTRRAMAPTNGLTPGRLPCILSPPPLTCGLRQNARPSGYAGLVAHRFALPVLLNGAHINPSGLMRNSANVSDNSLWNNRTNVYAQPISFDIAVMVEKEGKGGAKIKVLSGFFGVGGEVDGEKSNKNAVASRVQFTVPVLFPSQNIADPAARGVLRVSDDALKNV